MVATLVLETSACNGRGGSNPLIRTILSGWKKKVIGGPWKLADGERYSAP